MTNLPEVPAWVFPVEPYEGESLSHFLGRFCRANYATANQLGQKTGLGAAIARWEKFYLNPLPTQRQLEALAVVVRVEAGRLRLMLPGPGVSMKHEPIRLCAACYAEKPHHRIEWQFKETQGCVHHALWLLSECPTCGTRFALPTLWREGKCRRCSTSFVDMATSQKSY